jgi:hypothetical protein
MDAHYPTDEIPATPEYVLDVLRDWHAQLAAVGQAERNFRVTAETTVDEFADGFVELNWESCDWRTVADALNVVWKLDIPREVWQPILTPKPTRTLDDVARFLAERVRRPVIRPWRHIAGDCLPAGSFLTVRAMLSRAGEHPEAVTPSTPLEPFLTARPEELFARLVRLAPRKLPPMRFHPRHRLGPLLTVLGGLLVLVGVLCLGLGVTGVWVMGTGLVLLATGSFFSQTRRVEFPGLVTFRDLAYAIAGQQPRRTIQPTP